MQTFLNIIGVLIALAGIVLTIPAVQAYLARGMHKRRQYRAHARNKQCTLNCVGQTIGSLYIQTPGGLQLMEGQWEIERMNPGDVFLRQGSRILNLNSVEYEKAITVFREGDGRTFGSVYR